MTWKYTDHMIYLENQEEVLAKLTYHKVRTHVFDIDHTFVSPKLRGQGIASKMMKEAMIYFRQQGLQVLASCLYAHRWIETHEAYKDLTAPEFEETSVQCKI